MLWEHVTIIPVIFATVIIGQSKSEAILSRAFVTKCSKIETQNRLLRSVIALDADDANFELTGSRALFEDSSDFSEKQGFQETPKISPPRYT